MLTEARSLCFVRYDEGDALELNPYSILEPQNTARKIAEDHLEVVIMPLVAFDLLGNRLGTGGGYYDRTFAFLCANPSKKPLMIGLAYMAQQAENIPTDPWDIKLDGVLTEGGFIKLSAFSPPLIIPGAL